MEIVPFKPEHLAGIRPRVMTAKHLEKFIASYRSRGPAFTCLDGDVVLGCSGVVVEGDEGHAWSVLSDAIRKRPHLLHRAVLKGLREVLETHDLKRLWAAVHWKFTKGQQWLERLGFRYENTVKNYVNSGETYYRYVR